MDISVIQFAIPHDVTKLGSGQGCSAICLSAGAHLMTDWTGLFYAGPFSHTQVVKLS